MSEPLIHLNFDVETLGHRETSVVTTLSCVPFCFEKPEPYSELVLKGFYVKFNIEEQIKKYSRHVNPETVEWWKLQPPEARAHSIVPSKDDVLLEDGLNQLTSFINGSGYNYKKSYVWCRGNYFDFPMIQDLYRMIGQKPPYNGFKIRDTRTFIDILTGDTFGNYTLKDGIPPEFSKHHALFDAALDVSRMLEIYQNLAEGNE